MTDPTDPGTGQQPSEEELRALYEQELKRIRVEHVLIENIVTMVNLGRRRTGLEPGTEDERDPEQVRIAIEAVRAHLPLVEQFAPPQAAQIRDVLSQMQLAYVRIGGTPSPSPEAAEPPAGRPGPGAPPPGAAPPPPKPGETGPAQRSGRLWIPGQ